MSQSTKMTYQEILEGLKELCGEVDNYAWGNFDDEIFGGSKIVDRYGGEGQGETWYNVRYFPQHNVYIKVDGFYTSYSGTDFDDGWECCSEVKPQIKTITVYE